MQKYRLPKVIRDLLSHRTLHTMLDHMQVVFREIGVEHFTLVRLTPELDTIDETTIGTRGHREWYDNYFHRDNPDRDPLIIHAKQTVEPFFALDHITNPRRLEHIARLKLKEGLLIPVHGPHGASGVAWVIGERKYLENYKVVIQAIAITCYHHIEDSFVPIEERDIDLTKRERDVLERVAMGATSPEIAEMLNLSERTVEWYVAQILKKLGARNRIQAVVLAVKDKLIAA
jgi:LuxR family quorum sensing-dependent transcriptional regulator